MFLSWKAIVISIDVVGEDLPEERLSVEEILLQDNLIVRETLLLEQDDRRAIPVLERSLHAYQLSRAIILQHSGYFETRQIQFCLTRVILAQVLLNYVSVSIVQLDFLRWWTVPVVHARTFFRHSRHFNVKKSISR